VKLLSGCRRGSLPLGCRPKVNVQNTADFAVEIDFTTLDTGSKQGTLAYF
jgi:hypothetical protein